MSLSKWFVPAGCAVMLFALSAGAAPTNMQPGLWEITVKMEMAGMPAGMPATTVRNCVRPADIADGRATVPQNDPKCEIKDFRMQGNTATWRMQCKGPNAMTGSGSVTYSGTSYSGTTKISMNEGGTTMNMTQNFSGKRVGDCK